MNSDTDSSSLNGGFIDLALGSDLDGLTDNELNEELEVLSDADTTLNVTVKGKVEITKNAAKPQKLPSVLVIPDATRRSMNKLLPKKKPEIQYSGNNGSSEGNSVKKGTANGNDTKKGEQKKVVRKGQQSRTLVDMLQRGVADINLDKVDKAVKGNMKDKTKRPRSPVEDMHSNDITQPFKLKRRNWNQSTPISNGSMNHSTNREPEIVNNTTSLELKVCLANNVQPDRADLVKIKTFISTKIVEAMESGNFVPIFNDNVTNSDGVYVWCSDVPCAEWLLKVTCSMNPDEPSDFVVLPQTQVIQFVPKPKGLIKTLVTVPSRMNNVDILKNFAKLNGHINTEKWHIAHRRNKGSGLTLSLKMDRDAFEQIKNQNSELNWILKKVEVKLLRKKQKGKRSYERKKNQMLSSGNSSSGDAVMTTHKA